jgi:hypothetical protein
MTTTEQVISRFAQQAGMPGARMLRPSHVNVEVSGKWGGQDDTLFSYGHHFPLARIMPSDGNPRGWWLVNGDRSTISTGRHQNMTRGALKQTKLPMMIVPHSAINRAGIREDTITPVEILPDRFTWEPRTRVERPSDYELNHSEHARDFRKLDDGRWAYEAKVHHLGTALFTAEYEFYRRQPMRVDPVTFQKVWPEGEYVRGTAYFLSAFDENEPGFGLYFLAELPQDAHPSTVAEAFEALKPQRVKDAEDAGMLVLRQGDVFAIERDDVETKKLPGPSLRSAYVLGVNHQATEVRDHFGTTFARGFLRHRPREAGRRPEHRTLQLGDRKTWFELHKNTVSDGRSFSIGGSVD